MLERVAKEEHDAAAKEMALPCLLPACLHLHPPSRIQGRAEVGAGMRRANPRGQVAGGVALAGPHGRVGAGRQQHLYDLRPAPQRRLVQGGGVDARAHRVDLPNGSTGIRSEEGGGEEGG